MGFSLAIVSIFHGRVRRSAAKQTDIGKRYARAQLPDSMRLTL